MPLLNNIIKQKKNYFNNTQTEINKLYTSSPLWKLIVEQRHPKNITIAESEKCGNWKLNNQYGVQYIYIYNIHGVII